MKKYIANGREVTIFVKLNGRMETVRFHDMGQYAGKSVFVTADPYLANAIENHPRFGGLIQLEGGELEKVETPIEDTHVYERVYDYVSRTQNAIDILVRDFGCKRDEIKLLDDVLRKAMELNISFPKLNEKRRTRK